MVANALPLNRNAALYAVPLVIVEGFMSASGAIGWAPLRSLLNGFEEHLGGRKVLSARFVAGHAEISGF